MSNQDHLADISKKLSALIGVALTKDVGTLTSSDRVKLLLRFGLANQEIADILGTSRNTVEVLKSRARKAK
jgi:DNA-directed RNA polymerase specialized sigma24 family protein